MNTRSFKQLSRSKKFGLFLIGTTLAWSLGLPLYFQMASAASLTSVSDTLTSSAPSTATNHTFAFTTPTGVATAQTIAVTFDPTGSNFNVGYLGAADFVGETGITVVSVGACTGGPTNEAELSTTTESFTLTVCGAGDSIPAATTINMPITGSKITNPAATGSYVVRVAGTQTDSADTRVAIVNSVSMTAKVDTSFTFTVTGLATSTAINGTSTDITTLPAEIAWNTLTVGKIYTAAQQLNVATNAKNGFTVTLVENQNLLSSTGADIDLFKNGGTTTPAEAWSAPTNVLGDDATYGHFGITSDDTSLSSAPVTFGSNNWAGNIVTPREVFYHTGPSDGTTVNVGQVKVGFQIQIASLQEAGNDYNNTLTYVATPIF
jgi:hypothetical protein